MRRIGRAIMALALMGGFALGWNATAHAATAHAKKTVKEVQAASSFAFSPTKLKIKAGTKVIWSDTSEAPHTVTSDTTKWKFDKTQDPGSTLSYTFKKAGTYLYHCKYHSGMKAKIIVSK